MENNDYIFIGFRTSTTISDNTSYFPIKSKRNQAEKITLHGLRHTHATILIPKRPVNEVAHRLGNTPEMIHKVYGHLMEDIKKESVSAFSDSLKNVASGEVLGDDLKKVSINPALAMDLSTLSSYNREG